MLSFLPFVVRLEEELLEEDPLGVLFKELLEEDPLGVGLNRMVGMVTFPPQKKRDVRARKTFTNETFTFQTRYGTNIRARTLRASM